MEFIRQEAVNFSTQLLFNVGAERIPAVCAFNGIPAVRVLLNLMELLPNRPVFRAEHMRVRPSAEHPAVAADPHPWNLLLWVDRSPQHRAAAGTFMVFLVFRLEKELVRVDHIADAVVADLHLQGFHAVRAKKGVPAPVPGDGRVAHVAVPGLFLAEDRVNALVSFLVHGIQAVQVRDTPHNHSVGVRQGFPNLPDPLLGDMGGRHDDAEGLFRDFSALGGPQAVQRTQGGGADLRFARPTFRNNKRGALAVQLALDGFRHGKLGVVKGISGLCLDVVVDGQHLL